MGIIEARIARSNLGDQYRTIGFSPPLSQETIDAIHADEHKRSFGLPYLRLKTVNTPDKHRYTESTIVCGPLNPSQAAREIAGKIIEIATASEHETEGGFIAQDEYQSSRDRFLFGICSQIAASLPNVSRLPVAEPISDQPRIAA